MDAVAVPIYISLLALVVAVLSAAFTFYQLRFFKSQVYLEANSRILENTKSLISMGFQDAELFNVFSGIPFANQEKQRRYLQLWVNHIFIVWTSATEGLLTDSCWQAYSRDNKEFFSLRSVREHWEMVKDHYSAEFCNYIAGISTDPVKEESPSELDGKVNTS